MDIVIRQAQDRGTTNLGWLQSRHSFSFGEYYDPAYIGYHFLRVINQDFIHPGAGFAMHPHQNMEIITYIVNGAINHRDSMGNESTIHRGEIQIMSAGTGIMHSEFNASSQEPLELLQIWVLPAELGLMPNYDQMQYDAHTGLTLLAKPYENYIANETLDEHKKKEVQSTLLSDSSQSNGEILHIHQNMNIFRGELAKSEKTTYRTQLDRYLWLQMITGEVKIVNKIIHEGDGVAMSKTTETPIEAIAQSEFLLFDSV